jgi:predicted metallopeptidase
MAEAQALFDPDPDYAPSADVAAVAKALIRRHRVLDVMAGDLRIAYLERLGQPSGEGEGLIAACQKASPVWRDVAHVDVVIWVWSEWWARFSPRQREAVVMHELCHVGRNESGGVKLRKHDVEEFNFVVAHYGVWDDFGQLGDFMRSLVAGEGRRERAAQDEKPGAPEPIRLPAGRERRRPGSRQKAEGGDVPVITP